MQTLFYNAGTSGTFDAETGHYDDIPAGLYEFRAGDEVEHVETGERLTIERMDYVRTDEREPMRGLPILYFANGTNCLAHRVRPTLPERVSFAYMVHSGSALYRCATEEQANARREQLAGQGLKAKIFRGPTTRA